MSSARIYQKTCNDDIVICVHICCTFWFSVVQTCFNDIDRLLARGGGVEGGIGAFTR